VDQRIVETVRRIQPALEQLGIRPQAVVLFGSHATGEARPESDIDLAVLSDDFQGMNMLRRLELVATALARAKITEPIEALAYTWEEYCQARPGTLLCDEIKAKGVRLL